MCKKLLFIVILMAGMGIFSACEKNELPVNEPENKNLLPKGDYITFSDSEWEEFITNFTSSDHYSDLKSAKTFESMWDIQMKLDDLAADSTKTEAYHQLAKQYSHIVREAPWDGYQLITNSLLLARSFSSDGLLKIGDKIIEITSDNFIEHTQELKGNYKAVEVERKVEIFGTNPENSLKSTEWQSHIVEHKFSSSRKVKAYLFLESITNSMLSTAGVYSRYYRKAWANGEFLNREMG